MLTAADVAVFPAASRATAIACEPFVVLVVSHETEYGAAVSSAPRATPSRRNCTPTTPTLSELAAAASCLRSNVGFDIRSIGPAAFIRVALVTPGTSQNLQWREDFALRTLSAWRQGAAIWVSKRVLSRHPRAEELGGSDDRRVSWADFPTFFSHLEIGDSVGGEDGFVRLLRPPKNEQFVGRLANGGQSPRVPWRAEAACPPPEEENVWRVLCAPTLDGP